MKKFKKLLIDGINEDIQGSTIEKLIQVKQIFETEMVYNHNKPSMELLTKWLQGLTWAVHVPYENHTIIEWYEKQLNRKPKEQKKTRHGMKSEAERWIEGYWTQCGRSLYELLYK